MLIHNRLFFFFRFFLKPFDEAICKQKSSIRERLRCDNILDKIRAKD